jgi:hypothetical protein
MRVLMKAQLPSNAAGDDAAAPERLAGVEAMLHGLKAEGAYFYTEHGVRTSLVIFDLKSPSDMPPIAEPIFRQGGKVEFFPVMNFDELKAGVQKIQMSV